MGNGEVPSRVEMELVPPASTARIRGFPVPRTRVIWRMPLEAVFHDRFYLRLHEDSKEIAAESEWMGILEHRIGSKHCRQL